MALTKENKMTIIHSKIVVMYLLSGSASSPAHGGFLSFSSGPVGQAPWCHVGRPDQLTWQQHVTTFTCCADASPWGRR
ncbi:hypothetical protein E2C01_094893 [Portunus trituberculatus]|uniref:Uncharacterized protein n=1 Tax=Portunus trituberculatus TaxID=210409 RepID=A0A5B7K242_PORTR|nr:hypothetical protein [Portunus trituberculatus]